MDRDRIEEIELLDQIIVGRVDPFIYAFETNTVPNYLKVGDTYRPINVRLDEWKKLFPDLSKRFEGKAKVSDDVFFRDFAVHCYLERDLKKKRLDPSDISEDVYFSKEFFKETYSEDVSEAIMDIKSSYEKGIDKYDYYSAFNRLPETYQYKRQASWTLRPNQKAAVDQFLEAIDNGRTNLLMYAVMRFGKSFTALYCALEMEALITLVVSAKADVKDEWKKTVESAGNFEGFAFVESNDLLSNETIIEDILNDGKKVVLFLTLQDLQGEGIKDKHIEVFEQEIDLLIVDETHFGARAESFGAVLKEERKNIRKLEDESVEQSEVEEHIKSLNAKIKLHLSGTPYRILMGSEFEKEDIISFVQFSDIVAEQEAWDSENLSKDDVNEWDNPYFGFPQMIRFAFNANKSSIEKMNRLKESGVSFAFSALFEPVSIKKDKKNKRHRKFKNEEEILDLLQVIDGSKEDSNLLGFLDYDKIKEGKMCRHMVVVLPYCASCDAMEKLIKDNCTVFKNLNEYEIINISGVEGNSNFRKPSDIKNAIKEFEEERKKTITLTVNRMLTGSTVEQWDTMLYFKDTASPQEYDQAIFRLQNQYVRTLSNEDDSIKENLKPQTLLVDFDPNRLFRMQEQKSLIYNVNIEENGNAKLQDRIREELRISPVIVMNNKKIRQVEAINILEVVSDYNKNRSVSDEVAEIPVDFSILDDELIRQTIERQSDFNSRGGLSIKPVEGDGDELDLPEDDSGSMTNGSKDDEKDKTKIDQKEDIESLDKKIQTYYQRVLFYAFLSKKPVSSLDDIISSLDHIENKRLGTNLHLDIEVLRRVASLMDPFKRSSLDYKIQNTSMLAGDRTISPIERALTSLRKFNRMSESEIMTPSKVCDDMVGLVPDESLQRVVDEGKILLDIASKSGEYAVALYRRLTENLGYSADEVKHIIYSIPTSSIAYEFTRRFYEILELDTNNISAEFNAYDLLDITEQDGTIDYKKIKGLLSQGKKFNEIKLDDEVIEGVDEVKFGAIVGNPPYQKSDGGAAASAKPIYHEFVLLSKEIATDYLSFITPTRWFAGGKGLNSFRDIMLSDNTMQELHDILTPEDIFPGTNNRGGICYFLMNKNKTGSKVKVVSYIDNKVISEVSRQLITQDIDIFIRDSMAVDIIEKVFDNEYSKNLSNIVSARKPFGIESNIIKTNKFKESKNGMKEPIICIAKNQSKGFVEKENVTSRQYWIDKWKVYIPRANNIGTELNDDNLNAFIGQPDTVCTESYMIVGDATKIDETIAINLTRYMKTKFTRFLHKQAKASHDASSKTYRFVPLQDYDNNSDIKWSESINEIDEQLFEKYSLTVEEKEHIKKSIKDMDL